MLSNYYILHQVASELSRSVVAREFVSAYSQHAGELTILFDDDISITVILNPAHSTIYINNGAPSHIPKRNTLEFFKELKGLRLEKVEIAESDKKITFLFGEYALVIRFYDSPNALLLNNNELVATFKKESLREIKESKPLHGLAQYVPMIGKPLEKEFYARHPYAKNADDLIVAALAKEFDRELRTATKPVLYHQNEKLILSPIPLTGYDEAEKFNSASEAIEYVLRTRRKIQTLTSRKQALSLRFDVIAARTTKAIDDAERGIETSSRAGRFRAIADTITAIAYELSLNSNEIEFEHEEQIDTAPLDPKLSAYENAAAYYEKARRSAEAKKELTKRLVDLKKNQQIIALLLDDLHKCSSLRELDTFEEKIKQFSFLLEKSNETAERSGDALDRFRRFRVAGGFEVLAGKNAKQNDELTTKVATKEDLWFHARHVTGSHVVLRVAGTKNIPNEAIEQAASIAAFFSEASTQNVVPVAYTKRKYVRKPKGAAPGAVVIEREEVVLVEPKIPHDK